MVGSRSRSDFCYRLGGFVESWRVENKASRRLGMDRINVARVDLDLGGDRFRDSQFYLLDLRFTPYPALHRISALERCPCPRPVELLDFSG